jgi:hypothetical protein
LNYMLMQLVLGKAWAGRSAEGEAVPLGVSQLEGKMQSKGVGRESGVMLEDVGTIDKG